MGRIGRSFQLVGLSYRILMLDKELMVLPLISGAVTLLVALSFAFGLGITPSRVEQGGVAVYLPLFGMLRHRLYGRHLLPGCGRGRSYGQDARR